LDFEILYAPGTPASDAALHDDQVDGMPTADYPALIQTSNRAAFYEAYIKDVTPTTDDRPFFFHTTKLRNQIHFVFGKSTLFGNGLSALLSLIWISLALVLVF